MSRQLAGVASLTIDGDVWDVSGDLEYDPASVTREMMIGQSGVAGHKVMPKAGSISATLFDRSDATVFSLNQKDNATIVAVLANGKTVYGSGMVQTGEIAVRTAEGTFSVKFEGQVTEV